MKKLILLGLVISSVAFAKNKKTEPATKVQPLAEVAAQNPPSEMKISVKGMVCAFCAQGIEKNFLKQPEVSKVEVSLENKYVKLKFKEGKTLAKEKIVEILKEAGYESVFGE
jgi:periplasmic mercuric ion binding protein